MKCPVCSQSAPSGVCARPHEAAAVAAYLQREWKQERKHGRPQPEFEASRPRNVEWVDDEHGVTLIVSGEGTHVVRGDFEALKRSVAAGDQGGPGRADYMAQRHDLAKGVARIERIARVYGLEVEIRAPEAVR